LFCTLLLDESLQVHRFLDDVGAAKTYRQISLGFSKPADWRLDGTERSLVRNVPG
jgi:hypothetical protein